MKTLMTTTRCLALLLGMTAIDAVAAEATSEPEAIAGTRMRVDWQGLISGHNLELPKLPANHTDSLRLGNGDIGVAVYAVPECLVLFVGKNDLLDYRTKPLAHSPEATAMSNAGVPMPTTKPAGWIRFRNATPRNPDAKARLDIWNAEVSTRLANRQTPELRAFVAKNRNLIVTEYQPTSGEEFDIELARHKDTTGVIPTVARIRRGGAGCLGALSVPGRPGHLPERIRIRDAGPGHWRRGGQGRSARRVCKIAEPGRRDGRRGPAADEVGGAGDVPDGGVHHPR